MSKHHTSGLRRDARLAALMLLAVTGVALAADWPQWLGPNRDGKSDETVAPWKGELKVAWRKPVGEGHSSPVVANGRVFVHAKVDGKEMEEVIAFDVKDGKELWRKAYERPPYKNIYGNGPRSTPLVVGDLVITLGASGVLTAWKTGNGELAWQRELLKDFNAQNLFFGMSSSPVFVKNSKGVGLLLAMVGGPKASIVAINAESGKVEWEAGSDRASYSSPIVATHMGKPLGLFLTREGVTAINPDNGERYWQFPLVDKLNESSTTPVLLGDRLFASSVTFGSVGLKLTQKEGKPAYEEEWKNPQLTCYFATPIAVGEHYFVVTGQLLPPAAALHCVDAKTGKPVWTKTNVGKYHASLLLTRDRLLMLEEEGSLVLIETDVKQYKELARAKVCGTTWAHPALANGRLYVRDAKELLCVELPAGK
jgi:outer membrane protein assembly factor BamB